MKFKGNMNPKLAVFKLIVLFLFIILEEKSKYSLLTERAQSIPISEDLSITPLNEVVPT